MERVVFGSEVERVSFRAGMSCLQKLTKYFQRWDELSSEVERVGFRGRASGSQRKASCDQGLIELL